MNRFILYLNTKYKSFTNWQSFINKTLIFVITPPLYLLHFQDYLTLLKPIIVVVNFISLG